ncbi:MAG: sulfurtransferase-like selenium metabolism protein YedF [Thermovirgaceae bacterium]
MQRIDARGMACPKPVILAKRAVDEGSGSFEVVVDSRVSETNVRRFLESRGYRIFSTEGPAGTFTLECLPPGGKNENVPEHVLSELKEEWQNSVTILITSSVLGKGDDLLGEALMKAFLDTLAGSLGFTGTIALMNSGVMLALAENSASESLCLLVDGGCRLLVCGTCTNHYGITEKVSVGTVSNMFEIAEAVLSADKTVTVP